MIVWTSVLWKIYIQLAKKWPEMVVKMGICYCHSFLLREYQVILSNICIKSFIFEFWELKFCRLLRPSKTNLKAKKVSWSLNMPMKIMYLSKVLKCLNQCLRKVSPAKQLLIQQVGFVNLGHFFQHQSCAKHWFKNF